MPNYYLVTGMNGIHIMIYLGSWVSIIFKNVACPLSGNLPKNSWCASFMLLFPSFLLLAGWNVEYGCNTWSLSSFPWPRAKRSMLKMMESTRNQCPWQLGGEPTSPKWLLWHERELYLGYCYFAFPIIHSLN